MFFNARLLIEMFELNKDANIKMVESCSKLQSQDECTRLLSHLVNCQYKWLDRLKVFPMESTLDWWIPLYSTEDLIQHLELSSQAWIDHITNSSEDVLEKEQRFLGFDGMEWNCKLKDIALQLIFHSFHHRAQLQMLIRAQGQKPAFIDYIGYKAKRAEPTSG